MAQGCSPLYDRGSLTTGFEQQGFAAAEGGGGAVFWDGAGLVEAQDGVGKAADSAANALSICFALVSLRVSLKASKLPLSALPSSAKARPRETVSKLFRIATCWRKAFSTSSAFSPCGMNRIDVWTQGVFQPILNSLVQLLPMNLDQSSDASI
ncbi:MAG: hypothetical protein DLM68_06165 [Hyphomicrobiales bacterium]|nr:MAG: hypothetical protein DLM68_06165 [Hyphomicrobiales bacterium]